MEEIWKDIAGTNGVYKISNLGVIKSVERIVLKNGKGNPYMRPGKIIKIRYHNRYAEVGLYISGKQRNLKLHRLLAIHFIPNPENKPQINHKNGDRFDNRLENLEWVTSKENIIHSWANGTSKYTAAKRKALYDRLAKQKGINHPMARSVIDTKTGRIYGTITEAAKSVNKCLGNVSSMLSGNRNNITNLKYLNK